MGVGTLLFVCEKRLPVLVILVGMERLYPKKLKKHFKNYVRKAEFSASNGTFPPLSLSEREKIFQFSPSFFSSFPCSEMTFTS